MKKYLKPLLYLLLVLLFLVGTIWALRFARNQHERRVCEGTRVSIEQEDVFITEEEIIEELYASKLHPTGRLIEDLNAYAIEKHLRENSAIKEIHVFSGISGEVDVHISQRQPIVRVENAKHQIFYIGSDACLMAKNPAHTAKLLIANGNITESFAPNLNVAKHATDTTFETPLLNRIYELATFIRESEFFRDRIDQIHITTKNEFELVPSIGKHLILLGKADNYKDQFDRLEKFYTKGIQKVGWDAYKIINLKYDKQVVGVRNE